MDFNGIFLANGALSETLFSAAIIVASFLVAKTAYWVLRRYVQAIASRTKSTLDDRILSAMETPAVLAIISAGSFFALQQLSYLSSQSAVIEKVFVSAWIAIGALFATRFVDAVLSWYSAEIAPRTKAMMSEVVPTIQKVLRAMIIVIALIMVLDNFGVEVTPLIASLGIAGLAVALAFQDTLTNFFAGIYVSADRPVKVGDYIKLESGDEGFVVKIGWRSSQIRTLPNNIVVVPNSKLAQSIITNYYAPDKQMAVLVQASVGYSSDLEKVERVTIDVAKSIQKTVQGAVREFDPFIRYHTFGDSGINFSVIMRASEYVDQYLIKHEFVKALHKRYAKEGIEIPFPKRDVYLRKG